MGRKHPKTETQAETRTKQNGSESGKSKHRQFTTPSGLVTWSDCFEADENEKYTLTLLYTAEEFTSIDFIYDEIDRVVNAKYPNGPPKGFKYPIGRSEDSDRDESVYVPGTVYVSFSSKFRPTVVDENHSEIIDKSDFFPGCRGQAAFHATCWANKHGEGVLLSLNMVKRNEIGDPIYTGPDPDQIFGSTDSSDDREESRAARSSRGSRG